MSWTCDLSDKKNGILLSKFYMMHNFLEKLKRFFSFDLMIYIKPNI